MIAEWMAGLWCSQIGAASYHFEDGVGEGQCYISYESAPARWKLDDGSRPPARKYFESPMYALA